MKRPAGQQKFRASPAHGHKCQVCGANGHDLRTCKFPGAALVKKLLQEQGRKSRQTGRRPVRFGPRTQEAQKESRTKKYTGVTSKQKRLRERKERASYVEKTKKNLEMQVQKATASAQEVWERNLSCGLFRLPKACQKCQYGRYSKKLEFVKGKNQGRHHVSEKYYKYGHYVVRCGEQQCRHRLNVVRTGPWPWEKCRTLTLEQVDEIISMWIHASRSPPSAREVARRVLCSRYAANSLLDFLTEKTGDIARKQSTGAERLPSSLLPQNVYEIEGTGIGKMYVSWIKPFFCFSETRTLHLAKLSIIMTI